MGALVFRDVAFAYGDACPLFESVTLRLSRGIYGIVGENMIRVSVRNSVISQFTNAGVAMLSTGARNVYAG